MYRLGHIPHALEHMIRMEDLACIITLRDMSHLVLGQPSGPSDKQNTIVRRESPRESLSLPTARARLSAGLSTNDASFSLSKASHTVSSYAQFSQTGIHISSCQPATCHVRRETCLTLCSHRITYRILYPLGIPRPARGPVDLPM